MEKKEWLIRRKEKSDPDRVRKLAEDCRIDLFTASILYSRGYRDPASVERYLNPKPSDLSDPYLLPDMEQAVDRICVAVENGEKVAVYADYDADGTSAASILLQYFRKLGLKAGFYVPNRLKEGYGMNIPALEKIAKQGISLVISVDNGISSVEEAKWLKDQGIDLIITDHHEPHKTLPDALAIIDAKRTDVNVRCFREFCGAGVAFKLVQAMDQVFGLEEKYDEYLQMAACATVADLVPLIDENRTIVSLGLKGMNQGASNPGLSALITATGLNQITAGDIAYRIGPMLNAPGRLGRASESIRLLSGEMSGKDRRKQAQKLFQENEERKRIERSIESKAEEMVRSGELYKKRIIVLSEDSWHSGVIGIAASKIQEVWYRPVIIASGDGEVLRGSCRSVEGFNIFEALCSCADLFESFGGHEQAAGFSIKRENMAELDRRLNEYAKEVNIDPLLVEKCYYDACVQPKDLTWELERSIRRFEPCGIGNPGPTLLISPVLPQDVRVMGQGAKHLKFTSGSLSFVGFNMSEFEKRLHSTTAVLGKLKEHNYNGQTSLHVQMKDIKISPFVSFIEALDFLEDVREKDSYAESMQTERIRFRTKKEYSEVSLDRDKVLRVYAVLKKYPKLGIGAFSMVKGLNAMEKAAAMLVLRDEGLVDWKIIDNTIISEITSPKEKRDLSQNKLYSELARVS